LYSTIWIEGKYSTVGNLPAFAPKDIDVLEKMRDDAPSNKEPSDRDLGSEAGEEPSSSEGEIVAGSCLMPRGCGPSIDAVDDTSSNTTY
jgi:hypothetical protein